nr:uncharacterized protein LOC120968635 [Aegilops tauschii subsp. strangulata]
MCPEAEDSDTEPETPLPQTFKKVGKAGPTTRSHHEADIEVIPDFIPSDDSACFPGDYGISDSDDESGLPLPCGRKSQAKRARTRIWYDETKPDAHDQLCLSMCFTDVYQFRRALRNFHIRILRNFQYHRNCKDRIIVHCKERDNGCPFFMTASTIAHEKTFCIKKMKLLHTCGAHGEKTKVTVDWMARTCEQQLRDNPRAGVDAILKRTKTKYGLEVPKTKAYRARSLAIEVVEGDMKGQYTRFRDYLQAVLDTNPGSRCIVTTRELELHPSPNPRFHYMFYCQNASKEGLDGCFIKLSTGQQILAATGRDGNNNIFPIKRKQREDPMHHFEGDTEVEEMCPEAEDSDTEPETPLPQTFKKVGKAGPTTRSHHEADIEVIPDFIPSDDSACFPGDYGISDSDDESGLPLPCGRKSQAKRARTRIWYDETKPDAHDQLCLSMCFTDVYQFRRALRNFHIRILRNFQYHRNCKDRIIVHCKERDNGCPFFMTASTIAHEKTFCIKKMKLLHTCGAHGEKTKVTVDWMARTCEQQLRDNPRAGVDAILKRTKTKYGLEVPKTKAYRARSLAIEVVEGDMKGQYTRFRDYLQAVLDTNPGSRCIVTTRELELHPSPNPRFHYMFYCLNASKEGFLNGCRPFIGLDGCFIKLSTGQQILAATGRDGNNNIFPIAIGIVDKEDKESWTWFLSQLRACIGEGNKWGTYTIISDRQKGLLNAIQAVFPHSPQRYCLRHIYANFQSAGFRSEELKKHMDNAAYSYTKNGFEVAMNELRKEDEDAWKWLCDIPKETWARHAMDHTCKTDLVVNNLSEVFNKMILDVRNNQLRACIGEGNKWGTYTIISDRQKGLLNAIQDVFPHSPQRYCLRHIYANFQSAGFKSEELKKHMDNAAYSYTKNGFEVAMNELRKEDEDSWKWLCDIPKETWARHAMDHTCKTDLVVNNLSEVFNKMILDVRNKPIRSCVDGFRTKLMVKYQAVKEKTEKSKWEITPTYMEKLEESKKY